MLACHRVADRAAERFDPGVVTVDQRQLDTQIRYFKQIARIVSLDEALEIASGRRKPSGRAILLTFDDGYLDNRAAALPVLRSLEVSAVFFLVSGFLTGEVCPWWDQIAWHVRASERRVLELPARGATVRLDLRRRSIDAAIRAVIALYKTCSPEEAPRFLARLAAVAGAGAELPRARRFIGAGEARELVAVGMTISAHSHRHPILARLSADAQREEMTRSRDILEQATGARVDVFAYPVGGARDFDARTRAIAAECGFRAAFSCHGGTIVPGAADRYDLKREIVYWNARPADLVDD